MNKDDFDPCIPEDERRFYLKAYANVNQVRERKVHCTICKMHIGTAPSNESIIRMHPILRVTHCKKCHEFYNSGEFSKGEDGSELYCRWCGQGGEVYCCSNCPFVFCKSCIISNLSRGVVADIEQNENWSCFNCAPKMLWPLRAQHWALIKFIDRQKKAILNSNLSDAEIKVQMTKDRSLCCKIKRTSGYGTDSSDSSDISLSRLKKKAGEKRSRKSLSKEDLSVAASPAQAKKLKSNDEVVCTPDVMSMLEPECTLTVPANAKPATPHQQPSAPSPKIMSIQPPAKKIITPPPPLLVRAAQSPLVRAAPPTQVLKKTVIGPRMPANQGSDFTTPVYHTINGFRIDLNSAAQQETVRLPNGKLIQVKRQGTGPQQVTPVQNAPSHHSTPTRIIHNISNPTVSPIATNVQSQPQILHSSGGHIIRAQLQTPRQIAIQSPNAVSPYQSQQQQQQQQQQQTAQPQFQQITIRQPNQQIATIRYQGNGPAQVTNMIQNGTMQILNGTQITTPAAGQVQQSLRPVPTFIKQFFPNTPLGQSRNQLQNQIFNAMEICQHLMSKLQTLTNSNAYKTAKSTTDVKELYIHLSYLLTYAIGRFKGLQDNCLGDMRELGFTNDANSLENGQLAADKQASDAEEDEITIVEPKTDTINLDSDNEDDLPASHSKPNGNSAPVQSQAVVRNHNLNQRQQQQQQQQTSSGTQTLTVKRVAEQQQMPAVVTPTTTTNANDEVTAEYDFSKVASLLAGMLEVELTEGSNENLENANHQPKKPRKKTTHKPNPTLVKQKEMQERERLENIKKNCSKLKMEVEIPLNKVEEIYEYAKPLVEYLKQEKLKAEEEPDSKENEIENKKEEKSKTNGDANKNDINSKEDETEVEVGNDKVDKEDKEADEVVVVLVEEPANAKVEEEEEVNDKKEEEEEEVKDKDEEEEQKETDTKAAHPAEDESVEVIVQEENLDPDGNLDKSNESTTEESKTIDEKEDVIKPKEEKEAENEIEKENDEEEEKVADDKQSELIADNDDDVEAMEEDNADASIISINSEKNKTSELPLQEEEEEAEAEAETKDKQEEQQQLMEVDTQVDESDKEPAASLEVTQSNKDDNEEDIDKSNLDVNSLSHNYNAILGQTEVV